MSGPEKESDPLPSVDQDLPLEESRIIIRPDGEIVIEHLSELLAEVALQLDPDSESLQCRLDLGRGEKEDEEREKDGE
ncbi:MAG: hypothetical protein JW797_05320 [Bradymonadales bacterium]|nr:hypothetical protein [Bradymonadales bacterium]